MGNAAPDGSALSGGLSGLSMTRSIIAFHRPGRTILCEVPPSRPATFCDVYGNSGGDWLGCLNSKIGDDGNVSVDPGFRDLEGMDFRLRPESPLRQSVDGSTRGIGARENWSRP